ncbi:hypothetical protein B566_EDAN017254, partial [Ephemera danica]
MMIDKGKGQRLGDLDLPVIHSLYKKGLVYLEVPIEDGDHVVVPPLEGFVMNRVLGDYFETLLYKIFLASVLQIDVDSVKSAVSLYCRLERYSPRATSALVLEHILSELASVLQIDVDSVKSAVSLYCRLGFARKKDTAPERPLHLSWSTYSPKSEAANNNNADTLFRSEPETELRFEATPVNDPGLPTPCAETPKPLPGEEEVLSLLEPSPRLQAELARVRAGAEETEGGAEGEARRYFEHALVLRHTVHALRANPALGSLSLPLDLVRCESLQSLEPGVCARLLHKNYALLVSMAPLCREVRPVSSCVPPHLGPALPEVNSTWFKLFLYARTGLGPPSLLLSRGSRVRRLPAWLLEGSERLLVTVWGHDPAVLPASALVLSLSEALSHSAVLVQAVASQVDLKHNCGYVTLAKLGEEWTLLDCTYGVPLFDATANAAILRAIEEAGLWKPESLAELTQSSRLLSLR